MDTVPEQSTCKFRLRFKDEEGEAVSPTSVTWTLTNRAGVVINNRQDVPATPGSAVDILLKGDDLALLPGEINGTEERVILVEAVYSSSAGTDLPLRDQSVFEIANLVAVS